MQAQSDLDLAASDLGVDFAPGDTRRNITVDAGPIPTRPGERLTIGEVTLEVVRIAAPCRLLDDGIGPGAAAALRRRAGTVFRVLTDGVISLGDQVEHAPPAEPVQPS
jgi:MOSC domain-containing protein YiiM